MEPLFACLKPVESSMFSRAGFDESTWTLVLEFKSTGEIRAYKNVSPEVADEALSGPSLGKYFNANIKGNPGWEHEVLGADPSREVPQEKAKAKPEPQTEITDDDIRLVDPDWQSTQSPIEETGTTSESATVPNPPQFMHVSEVGDFEHDDAEEAMAIALATQPKGEVLAAWHAPETPVQAIQLLTERAGEIDAITRQNVDHGKQALEIRVTDAASYTGAGQSLSHLVTAKDKTFALLDPIRARLHEVYKLAGERLKAAQDPLETGITYVKRAMTLWEIDQERIRQQRMREEREKAEAEERRLQKVQSEQLTLAEVDDALEVGDQARAEELLKTPVEAPRPYVAPAFVEPTYLPPAGQSTRANWKIREETVDLAKFLQAVKDGKYPIEKAVKLVKPDLPALNKIAKGLESAFDVPGFEAFNDPVRSVRRTK